MEYTMELKGKQVSLGKTWGHICQTIDQRIPDRKLAISTKVCLSKKIKLRLTPEEEEELYECFKKTMYFD